MDSLTISNLISLLALAAFLYAPYEMQARFRRRRPLLIGASCAAVLAPLGAIFGHLNGWSYWSGGLLTWLVGTAICAGLASLAPGPAETG